MKISFLGAGREVGRSAIQIQTDTTLMLDYGFKQYKYAKPEDKYPLNVFSNQNTKNAILSHAHLDHSGGLPLLFQKGNPRVFMTPPTLPMVDLILKDSLKIGDAAFNKNDVKKLFKNIIKIRYNKKFQLSKNTSFTFLEAGHILGSAQTLIETEKKILYSGDFKMKPMLLNNGAKPEQADILIMESTYSQKDHPERKELEKNFCRDIQKTIERGGVALIPSFAIGRTQEMFTLLNLHGITPFVAGMGLKVSETYKSYSSYLPNQGIFIKALKKIIPVNKKTFPKSLEPGAVITTAGMLEGGPILNYLTRVNKNSKIYLNGFQAEDTNGRMLMEQGKIAINDRVTEIKTPFEFYDFSAHAGKTELLDYVKQVNPEKVFCVHGSEENCVALAENLKSIGFNATAPKNGETIII
jgi:putative mRNA 3-end processing factor